MKLHESLYIFLRYKQDIKYLFEYMIDLGYHSKNQDQWNLKEQTHYITLYNAILLNTCSYLDEYNNNFLANAENKFKDRILEVRKIAKPAFKKVNQWSDLREYRNHMIAHNFRINNNSFSFNMLGQYNVPRTYRDIVLLRKYLMMIQGIIDGEFNIEMLPINTFINSFPVKEQQVNYDTVEEDLKAVVDKINSNCHSHRKNYKLILDVFNKL